VTTTRMALGGPVPVPAAGPRRARRGTEATSSRPLRRPLARRRPGPPGHGALPPGGLHRFGGFFARRQDSRARPRLPETGSPPTPGGGHGEGTSPLPRVRVWVPRPRRLLARRQDARRRPALPAPHLGRGHREEAPGDRRRDQVRLLL